MLNDNIPSIKSETHCFDKALLQYHTEAEILLQEIERLIQKDPVAAAKAWIGRAHLMKYGFLLQDAEAHAGCLLMSLAAHGEYPYKFDLKDVLLEGRDITLQLLAIEYCENADNPLGTNLETSPYTPDSLFAIWDQQNRMETFDPFASDDRPDVNIEANNVIFNQSGRTPDPKPEFGFKEFKHAE